MAVCLAGLHASGIRIEEEEEEEGGVSNISTVEPFFS